MGINKKKPVSLICGTIYLCNFQDFRVSFGSGEFYLLVKCLVHGYLLILNFEANTLVTKRSP